MNFLALLWSLVPMALATGSRLVGLAVGATFHTTEAGIPPALVTTGDGRHFTVELHITRTG
ncbi:MAG: hypothetical protein AUI52_05485 [Acidobacteria bacterium 13_1_40CM_2_68_10]|nr:MAG: hypothetical protein AUI52_05485 [Acidobacteria bacterium 13_1_40CM_2_68_10]